MQDKDLLVRLESIIGKLANPLCEEKLQVGDRVRHKKKAGMVGTVTHVGAPVGGFKGVSVQWDNSIQAVMGPDPALTPGDLKKIAESKELLEDQFDIPDDVDTTPEIGQFLTAAMMKINQRLRAIQTALKRGEKTPETQAEAKRLAEFPFDAANEIYKWAKTAAKPEAE